MAEKEMTDAEVTQAAYDTAIAIQALLRKRGTNGEVAVNAYCGLIMSTIQQAATSEKDRAEMLAMVHNRLQFKYSWAKGNEVFELVKRMQ